MIPTTATAPLAADPQPPQRRWEGAGLLVDTAFPGGNLIVDGAVGDELRVRQDQRDSPHPWFHWHFLLRGAGGRRVTVRFGAGAVVGVRGPAVSRDDGGTWAWLDAQPGEPRDAFTIELPPGGRPLRLAMGIPHQLADWTAFATGHQGLESDILCRSRRGRGVPLARIRGNPDASWLLLVAARHHSCEAVAGFAIEGLAAAIAADASWRALAEAVLVPFVDLDGVEEGDQGKGRRPRDHGRDYAGTSMYPETGAIRAGLAGWAAGRRIAVVDLHCPWIAGPWNQHIYQVGVADPAGWARQRRLAGLLRELRRGPLPYDGDDIPFGTAWNTAANYRDGLGLRPWAAEQPDVGFATTFELPYADVRGVAVEPAAARAFGHDLAHALRAFLVGG